jgi:long-chain acyl-CoA synthetase
VSELITAADAGTLPGLLLERIRRTPEATAYLEYDATREAWISETWRGMGRRAAQFRAALARAGLKAGERVALLLPNSMDWVAFDFGAMSLGLVVVPLYAHDSAANWVDVLAHSEARLALFPTWVSWMDVRAHATPLEALEQVWIRTPIKGGDASDNSRAVRSLAAVLPAADGGLVTDVKDPRVLATLIYTSGTTGRPKGVMLSHIALLSNAEAAGKVVMPRSDDVLLSHLPLAHAFERTIGCYLAMMGGSATAYSRSIDLLRDDIAAIRPTIMLSVPRLYERLAAGIRNKVAHNPITRWLLEATADLGWRRSAGRRGAGAGLDPLRALLSRALDRLLAVPVRQALGGRLRAAVSGGAPLDPEILRFLIGLGIPLTEGYGLTEAGPVVAATTPEDSLPGSAGRPLPGVEVAIGRDSELLVRTPSLMDGYWRDAAATAAAIDGDGWLHTADLAEVRDGRVFILGRLKDVIVLATGEKVYPAAIETEICKDALFQQAVAVGEGAPCLVAVIVLDSDRWAELAPRHAWNEHDPNARDVRDHVLQRIAYRLRDMPSYAQIRNVHVTLEPWTIEAGTATPTLKLKRQAIALRFAHEIAALYLRS